MAMSLAQHLAFSQFQAKLLLVTPVAQVQP
jgi:hypothetical protein